MTELFKKYLPINAVNYCINISEKYNYTLGLGANRKSKFGHYKYSPQTKSHSISINRDLSPQLFLITYIHELAHLDVMINFGRNPKPHGKEWKNTFRKLLVPLLTRNIFDTHLLSALAMHLKNPKASLAADPRLWAILFPNKDNSEIFVKDIEDGEAFIFRDRHFKKIKSRRTRALCLEEKSGNNYLIPLLAKIKKGG